MNIADKLATIAENEQRVFVAGYEKGKLDGGDSHYDTFWDAYQQNGERTNYDSAFAGLGWNKNTFDPKYKKIVVESAERMFWLFNAGNEKIDFVQLGIELDFSKCKKTDNFTWRSSSISRLGTIDASSSTDGFSLFSYSGVETVDKIILSENTGGIDAQWTYTLRNFTIEGTYSKNLNLQWLPTGKVWGTSVSSLKSVIGCLKDFSDTEEANTRKLTLPEDCWTRLEADSTSPTGSTWREYVSTLGWLT